MKLHHFVSAKVSEGSEHIRELGKNLVKPTVSQPLVVVEARKKVETKKVEASAEGDMTDLMHDFAHQQLADTNPLFHRKYQHHD